LTGVGDSDVGVVRANDVVQCIQRESFGRDWNRRCLSQRVRKQFQFTTK